MSKCLTHECENTPENMAGVSLSIDEQELCWIYEQCFEFLANANDLEVYERLKGWCD